MNMAISVAIINTQNMPAMRVFTFPSLTKNFYRLDHNPLIKKLEKMPSRGLASLGPLPGPDTPGKDSGEYPGHARGILRCKLRINGSTLKNLHVFFR